MPYFRRIPEIIEAMQGREAIRAFCRPDLPAWLAEARHKGLLRIAESGVCLHTRDGEVLADYDDWLIKGADGDLSACGPDVFARTYEPVPGPLSPATSGDSHDLDELLKIARQQDEDIFQTLICGAGVPEHILRPPHQNGQVAGK